MKRIDLHLKPELYAALKKEATERGNMSVSALIRYYCMRGMIEFED